jgi:hypothetical protein
MPKVLLGLIVALSVFTVGCDEVVEPVVADVEIDTPIVEVVEVKKVPEPGLILGLGAVVVGMFFYKK